MLNASTKNKIWRLLVVSLSLYTSDVLATQVDLSGFVRIVAGHLDKDGASYEGYDNSLSLSEDSLLGIQAETTFSDAFGATVQLLGNTGEDRDSGIEWAYFSYQPIEQLLFKVGRMRTPFFALSDVIDVGFAYPYITPPQQIYSGYMIDQYEGINIAYDTNIKGVRLGIETFVGQYDDDVVVANLKVPAIAKDMAGLIAKLGFGNFEFRSAITTGRASFERQQINDLTSILTASGFNNEAASLTTKGRVKMYQNSIEYDNLDYFLRAEWIRINSDFLVVPTLESHYLTVGINLPPFTVHTTYAESRTDLEQLNNGIPLGLSPSLDMLHFGYQAIIDNLPEDTLKSLSIGVRWDVLPNLALKSEITKLDGEAGQRSFFELEKPDSFNRQATLYTLALEWVF